MAELVLKGLSKQYVPGVDAVSDVDMTIADGEMVVFVGASGCGKTTTLRMIAGLERITRGVLTIDGKVVNNLTASQRNIAMVFQNYALYPHMTVRDNIRFPLQAKKIAADEQEAKVQEVAELVDIGELLDRVPRQLSGGQQQRVALARAVVRSPSVLLMDEPLSNLDAKLRVRMRNEIREFQRRVGITTIYVTHDQTEAMTMGNRIAVMIDGQLGQFDTPEQLYSKPASSQVAQIIGSPSMNIIVGTTVQDGGVLSLRAGSLVVPLQANAELIGRHGATPSVSVGVRPNDLLIGPAVEDAVLVGRDLLCTSCEVTGSTVYYRFEYDDAKTVTVEVPTGNEFNGLVGLGERRDLFVRERSLHVFDGEGGQRLF